MHILSFRKLLAGGVGICLCAAVQLLTGQAAYAASWTDPYITVSRVDDARYVFPEQIHIKGRTGTFLATVTHGRHIDVALYTDTTLGITSYGKAIKAPMETEYTKFAGLPTLYENTDIMSIMMSDKDGFSLYTTVDAWSSIVSSSQIGVAQYKFGEDLPRWLPLLSANYEYINVLPPAFAASPNGQYMAALVDYKNLILIDVKSGTAKYIRSQSEGSLDLANKQIPLAVSNDGRYIFTNPGLSVIDTQNCGTYISKSQAAGDLSELSGCEPVNITPKIAQRVPYTISTVSDLVWIDNDTALQFNIHGPGPEVNKVTLRLEMDDGIRLQYLALGDSYSSGEGDFVLSETDRHKNFLPYTDESGPPVEKCHVSYHSYPFLLRDKYHIDPNLMHSVACSGARTIDVDRFANSSLVTDYPDGVVDQYHGQGDRLLGLPNENMYRDQALREFIPGRIEQERFVEHYQPWVVTMTMGGNDIGFSNIVKDCIRDPWEGCPESQTDGEARQRKARLIKSEFYVLRDLYLRLRRLAPSTKLYAIGYPQFISDNSAPCELNAWFAGYDDRHLMNEGTHYMNLAIKAAAQSAGVEYIDIEHSLDGGRLCEGLATDYVTGARNEWWRQAIKDHTLDEYLFHPNAAGHQRIAETISYAIGGTFGTNGNPSPDPSVDPPDYTDYFAGARQHDVTTLPTTTLNKYIVTQGGTVQSMSVEHAYQPDTDVTVSRYSTPENLGTYKADNKGRLQFSFTIPSNFPSGYHTLVFDGTSMSGEPIEYVEQFFVLGSDSNDIDTDGVTDKQDKCLFITPVNQDIDGDGIDDACDDNITKAFLVQSKNEDTSQVVAGPTSQSNEPTRRLVLSRDSDNRSAAGYSWTLLVIGGSSSILIVALSIIYKRRLRGSKKA